MALRGAVSSGETVQFSRTAFGATDAQTLQLGDPTAFAGTLANIGTYSVVDFRHLDLIKATTSGDSLKLEDAGGATLTLALAAPLAPGTGLVLHTDGAGGTDLTFT